MHRAEEDYIKTIYKQTIEAEKEMVKTTDIALAMGFTDQTVNEMVKRLAKKKMIEFIRYKGVFLTKKGTEEAIRLVRNHRLWEVFLVSKLDYLWTEVHDEAEDLEHASSDKLMDAIDKFLKEPTHCVHGNAIPKKDGSKAETFNKALISFNVGDELIVKRVVDQPVLLKYLSDNNIFIGANVKVVNKDDFNGIMQVLINEKKLVLSTTVTDKIFGEATTN